MMILAIILILTTVIGALVAAFAFGFAVVELVDAIDKVGGDEDEEYLQWLEKKEIFY